MRTSLIDVASLSPIAFGPSPKLLPPYPSFPGSQTDNHEVLLYHKLWGRAHFLKVYFMSPFLTALTSENVSNADTCKRYVQFTLLKVLVPFYGAY